MALTVGRAGRTLTLPEPSRWDVNNGLVTLAGMFQTSPVTDAMRLRDQLLGYQDNWDEPIVPVTVASEPRLTGYYRVLGVRITTDVEALNSGYLGYEVALQAVMGFTQPVFESILTGALLTNVVGGVIGDVQSFHYAPVGSVTPDYSIVPAPFSLTASRVTADSALALVFASTTSNVTGVAHFSVVPANFYFGAATIEQGSPLQPVVGRTLAQADVVNWRLSNGLVRVTDGGGSGVLNISHYNGSSWSTAKGFSIVPGVGWSWTMLTILRNSVEETVIRLSGAIASAGRQGTVDLSLRRGDRIVRIFVTSTQTQAWVLSRTTPEAATAITYGAVTLGGFRATVNDGDGNRYAMFSYQQAATSDLVNGKLTLGVAATKADFAIASIVPGTAGSPDDPVSIAGQYLAAQSESQRIVAR